VLDLGCFTCCGSAGCGGLPSQGSLSQVAFRGRLRCSWADTSTARADPGCVSHSGSQAEDPLRHTPFCSMMNVSRGCLSQLPREVGLGAAFGEGAEQR